MLWDVGLRLKPGEDVGKYAILWRDEFGEKAELIAGYLDKVKKVREYREYTVWTGYAGDVKTAVIATGWGSASASVVVEELANVGIKTVIRVGACGSIQRSVKLGDIIIAEAAVRADGASMEYMPPNYPAVADFNVTKALIEAAKRLNEDFHIGITRTHDAYYVETNESLQKELQRELRESRIHRYAKVGVLAVENEGATTFVVSRVRGLRSGAYFYVTGNMITDEELFPPQAKARMKDVAKIGIEAVKILEGM